MEKRCQEQSGVKTEAGYDYYQAQAHYPDYQAPAPLTPVSPMYQSDNSDTSGVFSDYSLHSPVWTPQQQQHYTHFQQQQHVTSTTEQISSDEEEDVIDAIADWQQHL